MSVGLRWAAECSQRAIEGADGTDGKLLLHHVRKVVRKIQATNELFHKALGSIDTPEKFEAKRLKLAKQVWSVMKKTDSCECRNCHNYDSMDFAVQGRRAVNQHSVGLGEAKTCVDCHKGIAHQLPDMRTVDPASAIGVN